MDYCTDCNTVEGGFEYAADDVEQEIPICKTCGMEDTRASYDEDAGKDR